MCCCEFLPCVPFFLALILISLSLMEVCCWLEYYTGFILSDLEKILCSIQPRLTLNCIPLCHASELCVCHLIRFVLFPTIFIKDSGKWVCPVFLPAQCCLNVVWIKLAPQAKSVCIQISDKWIGSMPSTDKCIFIKKQPLQIVSASMGRGGSLLWLHRNSYSYRTLHSPHLMHLCKWNF